MASVGNYELIDRFAVGGVAEIYRARDVRTGEVVVIKRMRPDTELTPDTIAAFAREMHVAFRAKHKNLIRCFNLGSHQNLDFGVLEYVDGQDLENLLVRCRKQNIQLPRSFATFIACEILDGLAYAHAMVDERGEPMALVHRDVAPKNIFVRYDGQVRVADFGLGLASAYERLEDEVVGTPGYFAPEQVLRTKVDGRTDVFAVGLILHEMLSGQRALDVSGLRDAELLKAHKRPAIRPLGQDVPEGLRTTVEVALEVNPDDRYRTARDFRQAIVRSEVPPDTDGAPLGIATMLRQLFDAEFKATRLSGGPLSYMSK